MTQRHRGAAAKPAAARPTMRDVAEAAQVSVMTVSRVVNADGTVSTATRERVQNAIDALRYRPNGLARGLRPNQSTGLLGLLVANLANPFYSQLAVAVERRAREQGYALIISNTSEDAERERELVEDLLGRGVDGLLIVPAGQDYGYLAPEMERGTSVVFVTRPPLRVEADAAFVDDFGGAHEGVGSLIARGHRRIGYLGHTARTYTAGERLRGYTAALADEDLPAPAELVREDLSDPREAAAAAADLLGAADPPTALFSSNNVVTAGALRAIRRQGRPVDLVGFDDVGFADLTDLAFTVVDYDADKLGRISADLLTSRIAGRTGPAQHRIVSTRLARRGREG